MTVIEAANHPDPSDIASDLEMQATGAAISAAQRRAAQDQKPNADGSYAQTDCDDCGDEIGEARLRIAPRNLWCVYCATRREANTRR